MNNLNLVCDIVRAELTIKNDARDKAISQSRELIRHCSESIRAIHRHDWKTADKKLANVKAGSDELKATVSAFPELYYTGYTQDAFKEVAEAYITYAIIRGNDLPTPAELEIEGATYLKGMGEAATELRRFILDIMRREDEHSEEAEKLLEAMDSIYDELVTFDFPDALTYGLRRQTDIVRGVLERTRGDLTYSLRQQKLQDALAQFEAKYGNSSADGQIN